MKKFKKALALSLALAMGLSLTACGKEESTEAPTDTAAPSEDTEAPSEDTEAPSDDTEAPEEAGYPLPAEDGEKIYIYSWNDELGGKVDGVLAQYPQYKDLVECVALGTGGTDPEYKTGIDGAFSTDKVPSIIAADNDFALYFMNQDYAAPVSDFGITADMYANAFQYTVDFATVDGELKALTWQCTPGCFIYRTDIAEEVLGTSDPAEVQEYVKDWDTFWTTAQTMKDAGYAMLSGPDDLKYVCLDQKTSPWVVDDKLNIDPAITDYMEKAKKAYDEGYTLKTTMWSNDWTANMAGDVFGYFGCTWFTYWSMPGKDAQPEVYGKRHMVTGPAAYHWGGTYLIPTNDCPNKELAGLILYTLCCDTDYMYTMGVGEAPDFVNNTAAIEQLIADGNGTSEILGGQNAFEVWYDMAGGISLKNATDYDATFNGYMDSASSAYNSGELKTIDDAVANIKSQVQNAYDYITIE